MKSSILAGAIVLLGAACSSSPDGGGAGTATGGTSASGAPSNTGATPSTGAGSGPILQPEGGTNAGGSGGTSPVDNGECAQQSVVVGSKPADVLLVLDRSKSMIENFVPPDGASRWDAVVPALKSVITGTNATVSWGLKLFPEGEGKSCAEGSVTDAIPVPIMPGNATAVTDLITATMALGNGTPTGEAIEKATAYLEGRAAANQFILLATDGDPSCPDDAEDYAIDAITAAKAAGYPVYVVGVLDPEEDESKFDTLNAMAEAGGTARTDAGATEKFYQAYSQEELTRALEVVTGQVVSCDFELASKPPVPDNIAVSVNGAWLERDTTKAQGWDYTSDGYETIRLQGDACQALKTAKDNKVDIIFGCAGKPIEIPK
jgi:von Willebrand factor type A domain